MRSGSRVGSDVRLRLWLIALLVASLLVASRAFAADTYKYDAQGRLVEIDFSGGSKITYTYDAAGNRTATVQTP